MLRTCSICGETKDISLFPFSKKKRPKGGYYAYPKRYCKACDSKKVVKWKQQHQEQTSQYMHNYYLEHKPHLNALNKKYHDEHREEIKAWNRKYYKTLDRATVNANVREDMRNRRDRLVELLGGKCWRCGHNEYKEILQFHHIIPLLRKTNGFERNSGEKSYPDIEKHPEKYRLLCPNCHALQTIEDRMKWQQGVLNAARKRKSK